MKKSFLILMLVLIFSGTCFAGVLPNDSSCLDGEYTYYRKKSPAYGTQYQREYAVIPATIDGKIYNLEAEIYRPIGNDIYPVIIMNHGRRGCIDIPKREPTEIGQFADVGVNLVKQGFVAVTLMRRGYGNSEGPFAEQLKAYEAGLESAKDIKACVEYMQSLDYVKKDKIVLLGQSAGGLGVIAAASQKINGVVAVINFSGAGGLEESVSNFQSELINACTKYNKTTNIPSLWIYANNDGGIPVDLIKKMYNEEKSNGNVKLLIKSTNKHPNGHLIVFDINAWMEDVKTFLKIAGI